MAKVITTLKCRVDDFPPEFSMGGKRLRLKSEKLLPSVGSGCNIILNEIHNLRPGTKVTITVTVDDPDEVDTLALLSDS